MEMLRLEELVLNFEDLYPRASVDSGHVTHLAEAMSLGIELPPIIADRKSKTVIDGFHRYHAAKRLKWPAILTELRDYKSAAEMFLDAMHMNAGHGRTMSNFDRAHCVILAARHKLQPEQIATALSITVEKVGELRSDRVGKLRSVANTQVPLKRTIHHMAGQTLSKTQVEAQTKLGGMDQIFYVNQLIVLIENDLLDTANNNLMHGIQRLTHLLNGLATKVA